MVMKLFVFMLVHFIFLIEVAKNIDTVLSLELLVLINLFRREFGERDLVIAGGVLSGRGGVWR